MRHRSSWDFIGSNNSLLVMTSFMVSYFFNLNPTSLFPLFAYLKYIKIIIKISLTFNNGNKKPKSQNLGTIMDIWKIRLNPLHEFSSSILLYPKESQNGKIPLSYKSFNKMPLFSKSFSKMSLFWKLSYNEKLDLTKIELLAKTYMKLEFHLRNLSSM